jgi:class 3 adenylate cyclase
VCRVQPPDTQYVQRPDGVSIAYQVVGSGRFDLLFAPAFISHLDFVWTDPAFARFAERLSSFARVILFDKPGTGLSDPIPHVPTLEERAEDIRFVLDAAGSARTVLFGFSESGPTCIYLAAIQPERFPALVLGGTFTRVPEPDDPDIPADVRQRTAELWAAKDEIAEHWGEGRTLRYFGPSIDTPLQRRFWGRFERTAASRSTLDGLFEFNRGLDVREVARNVHVPALVVHATGDFIPMWSGHELAELLPNSRLVELPGRDHAVWFGDSEAILDEVEEFLTGARGAPPPKRQLATVLFTDIVDSTAKAAELGDSDWRVLLERHNALVEQLVARSEGRIIKFIGDGTLSNFAGPVAAVECAHELLREARMRLGVTLRAGVHTGDCETIGDDLAGLAVHIGARVSAKAGADEVLVSSTVRDLAIGSGLRFEERGTYELKGLPGKWTLHALRGAEAADRIAVKLAAEETRFGDRAALALARRAPRLLRGLTRATRRQSEVER